MKVFFKKIGFLKHLAIFFFMLISQKNYAKFSLDSTFNKKPKFFFQLDATNSFVSGRGANAIGFKAGLDFGKRIKFGAGYHTVVSDIVESKYISKYDSFYNAKLQMNYYTTFVDYILYDQGRWQFSILNQFGIGNSYFWYYPNRDENRRKTETLSNKAVILYEPMAMGHFKIMKWFGVGFGTGYRIMLLTNKEIDHKLSSPVYAFRIKIFVNEIYDSIWPNGLFKKKKEKK